MPDKFKPFAREIVAALLKCNRSEQRILFTQIVRYLRREAGLNLPSVYDFLNDSIPGLDDRRRAELLANVCRALRDGDLAALEAASP